ncbi:hypothetical protein PoB_000913400 [Plakobranchus ocellatus]|uniref:Uncharacterized protein n=1 Tax=Plakobranchus ocellatus TaxID=259542 RepID=A0AAV3YKQ0_9GAST|nr:hypothetical protein PoB_000913400 [Plakobranchus ocellatus]
MFDPVPFHAKTSAQLLNSFPALQSWKRREKRGEREEERETRATEMDIIKRMRINEAAPRSGFPVNKKVKKISSSSFSINHETLKLKLDG